MLAGDLEPLSDVQRQLVRLLYPGASSVRLRTLQRDDEAGALYAQVGSADLPPPTPSHPRRIAPTR